VDYIAQHVSEVVKLPLDLSCISGTIIARIAERLDAADLDRVRDARDKLLSRLYEKKVAELIAAEGGTLCRCAFCNKVFSPQQVCSGTERDHVVTWFASDRDAACVDGMSEG
jgi:hypothetical protein